VRRERGKQRQTERERKLGRAQQQENKDDKRCEEPERDGGDGSGANKIEKGRLRAANKQNNNKNKRDSEKRE